jgi:hypothetical protein
MRGSEASRPMIYRQNLTRMVIGGNTGKSGRAVSFCASQDCATNLLCEQAPVEDPFAPPKSME